MFDMRDAVVKSWRASLAFAALLFACGALAQSPAPGEADRYPSKPIRAVVPSTPGGALDVLVRLIGPKMSQQWGQQVIADIRPGAGGVVGSEYVSKAAPDGYTILAVASGHALDTLLYSKLPYDTFRDFERVTIVAYAPNVLVVHPSLPVHSVRELIALANARAGSLNYASSGVGTSSYLSGELFLRLAGIKLAHVAYKGAGASTIAVVSGEVPIIFSGPSNVLTFMENKRLRALAVTSPKRLDLIPNVPALAESVPGYQVQNFFGIVVPGKTPRPIVDRLRGEIVRTLNLPDVRERLVALGFVLGGNTPEEFTAYVQAEISKWGKVFKELGIKPE
jgi:tripartite-type tricarboxylate transporter receptor subunit TctC